ncbi:MAG: FtsX-like permease family protein [Vicinamibacterales bacterium]
MPFELHIALRYLLARRKQAFISVISLLSTLGVTVGVMALVIALALMTGMQGELTDKLVGSNPHIYVFKPTGLSDYRVDIARLRAIPHVVGAAPTVLGKALITVSGQQEFINLKGIDPAREASVTDIRGAMRSGSLEGLVAATPEEPDGILLGVDLATRLGVSRGDAITVLTPQGTLTPMGMFPRARKLKVAGTFQLGLYEIDSETGLLALDIAKRLLDRDEPDAIQLKLDDLYLAPGISEQIEQQFGKDYVAQDWADLNKTLFSALNTEKIAISLAIGLIVMVAALSIVVSLILLVMEKQGDIAILKTMGAGVSSVMMIFMLQGVIIGVVGTAVGAALGVVVSEVLDRYQLISVPVDVYQISHIPFRVVPLNVVSIVVGAVAICFVATLYPSRQAAKLDPVQALRHE